MDVSAREFSILIGASFSSPFYSCFELPAALTLLTGVCSKRGISSGGALGDVDPVGEEETTLKVSSSSIVSLQYGILNGSVVVEIGWCFDYRLPRCYLTLESLDSGR